jgi:hypothetical protein
MLAKKSQGVRGKDSRMGTVIVREPNGEALALACSTVDAGGQAVVLDRVTSGKGRLLRYYFGEGNRAVVLEMGDFRLRGMLRTAWQGGERRWRVQLERVGPTVPAAAAQIRAEANPAAVGC